MHKSFLSFVLLFVSASILTLFHLWSSNLSTTLKKSLYQAQRALYGYLRMSLRLPLLPDLFVPLDIVVGHLDQLQPFTLLDFSDASKFFLLLLVVLAVSVTAEIAFLTLVATVNLAQSTFTSLRLCFFLAVTYSSSIGLFSPNSSFALSLNPWGSISSSLALAVFCS